jgi:hypothetical protein
MEDWMGKSMATEIPTDSRAQEWRGSTLMSEAPTSPRYERGSHGMIEYTMIDNGVDSVATGKTVQCPHGSKSENFQ